MHTEEEVEGWLLDQAHRDLARGGHVRPCLVAQRDDELLFVAFLRPFGKGEHADPLIELLALAAPLGANRLGLSLAGRAWSLHDPLAPVVDGLGDLRQQVVCITLVDGDGDGVRSAGAVHPFTRDAHSVHWGQAIRETGRGWIVSALEQAIGRRSSLRASKPQMRSQTARLVARGHLLAVAPAALDRMGMPPAAR